MNLLWIVSALLNLIFTYFFDFYFLLCNSALLLCSLLMIEILLLKLYESMEIHTRTIIE